jgi:hypothetical protein
LFFQLSHVRYPTYSNARFQGSSRGTDTNPHAHKSTFNAPNTQGITPADKIRYGQSIQEGGMGGKTAGMAGQAKTEGGFGGTVARDEDEDSFSKQRRAQGYGGEHDMDKNIGG